MYKCIYITIINKNLFRNVDTYQFWAVIEVYSRVLPTIGLQDTVLR